METISIFFSSNEGIVITTLSVTNCIFLISTIFLTLLRKAKQGGENGENIELQQMLPLPAEEIQAPQAQDQQAQDPPALAEQEN